MTRQLKEIDMIYFGVASPEDIKANAVCKITSTKKAPGPGTVYDEKMGAAVDSDEPCVTCGMGVDGCPGHFGYIELNQYVINPRFAKYVYQYLTCICMNSDCNKLMLNDEQIQLYKLHRYKGAARFNMICERLKKNDICCHCKNIQPKISFSATDNTITMTHTKKKSDEKDSVSICLETDDIKKIFDNLNDDDIRTLGFDPTYVHPKNLILSVFPVAPPALRPYVFTDGQICDDDLTIWYIEIIKANIALGDDDIDEKEFQKKLGNLKFHIATMFDNTNGKAKHSQSNRVMLGIRERLTGKKGMIRDNLMGKRVDFSARTPIGPDPTLKLGQLGIPPEMAEILTVPERVTKFNYENMSKIVNNERANYVINNAGKKITLKFLVKKGTRVMYGDFIIRGMNRIEVTDVNFQLQMGDMIERNGKVLENIKYPEKKRFYKLEIGNIVYRKLKDGDYVLLNRQPTLHSGSMMAMQVLILPGKNLRMNLSITKSFNADGLH
jgi:DNA-directed RNA polymerase beta' subunit